MTRPAPGDGGGRGPTRLALPAVLLLLPPLLLSVGLSAWPKSAASAAAVASAPTAADRWRPPQRFEVRDAVAVPRFEVRDAVDTTDYDDRPMDNEIVDDHPKARPPPPVDYLSDYASSLYS